MNQVIFVDFHDSFSHNLVDWLCAGVDAKTEFIHLSYLDVRAPSILMEHNAPVVLSPGPNDPFCIGPISETLKKSVGTVPILGICLGHQILASFGGFDIVKSQNPVHGLIKKIYVEDASGLLKGMNQEFSMASYNSLVAKENSHIGLDWHVTSRCALGEVQSLEYRPQFGAWAFGLQCHPESFLSIDVSLLRDHWFCYSKKWSLQQQQAFIPSALF